VFLLPRSQRQRSRSKRLAAAPAFCYRPRDSPLRLRTRKRRIARITPYYPGSTCTRSSRTKQYCASVRTVAGLPDLANEAGGPAASISRHTRQRGATMVRKASWPTSSFSADSVVQPVDDPAETELPSLLQSLVDEVGGTCDLPSHLRLRGKPACRSATLSGRWLSRSRRCRARRSAAPPSAVEQ
jgi:hypothetical protein